MKNLGFNHYNLRASFPMLDTLRDFYCEIVGLCVGARPPLASEGYWLYAGEQGVLHLSLARPGEPREGPPAGTFDHVAFTCTGCAGYQAMLDERGVDYRVVRLPESGQVQIFLRDPAGNGVELNFAPGSD